MCMYVGGGSSRDRWLPSGTPTLYGKGPPECEGWSLPRAERSSPSAGDRRLSGPQRARLPGQREPRPAPGRSRRAARPEFGAGQVEEEQEQQRQETAAAADATLSGRRLALHGGRRRVGLRRDARERRRSPRCPLPATASRLEVGLSRRSSNPSRGLVACLCRRSPPGPGLNTAPSPTGRGARPPLTPPRLCSARPGPLQPPPSGLAGQEVRGPHGRPAGGKALPPACGGRFTGAGKRGGPKARRARLPARGSRRCPGRACRRPRAPIPRQVQARCGCAARQGERRCGTSLRAPNPRLLRAGAAAGAERLGWLPAGR